jgi:hypothetical protein
MAIAVMLVPSRANRLGMQAERIVQNLPMTWRIGGEVMNCRGCGRVQATAVGDVFTQSGFSTTSKDHELQPNVPSTDSLVCAKRIRTVSME